jgi:hypothetical protein
MCWDVANGAADDTCSLTSFGALTCSGAEVCNRTTSGAKTVIALRREEGGGSGTAVALGVALGVGIGVPVGLLLLFLFCVLPLILLPLLWYLPPPPPASSLYPGSTTNQPLTTCNVVCTSALQEKKGTTPHRG